MVQPLVDTDRLAEIRRCTDAHRVIGCYIVTMFAVAPGVRP